ncbi:MAG TPA: dynamin family protein [Hyphomicrobiales bacterium]|nr:dynamin family protein [Hyphomicrobiales bacterium]
MVSFFKFLSAKRQTRAERKLERSVQPAAVGAYQFEGVPAAEPSALLQDVLANEPSAGSSSSGPDRFENRRPLSQRLNVGAKLAEARKSVIEAASKLNRLVDEETARAIDRLVGDLENRVCRIAFIGQMNAGKSSLINVLIEQAELLPADINPWTTVITNLHFGVPGTPSSGASFTFFSREEWQRLSLGGRMRELTERIFPNFDWDALNRQVEIMQKRAEKKLGPRLDTLLGTGHDYPAVTPGLLNRYVGAGVPEVRGQTNEGEFSDITKIANVFFDLGAFNFPAILVDTPGVNDPFLVRDEITRQSLETTDICVIVVTARQPLSTADLGLLRLLRGLNKSRVIIFVNKMDEIDAGEETRQEITRRIDAILTQEFPGARIPIIFGSAVWARNALLLPGGESSTPKIAQGNAPIGGSSLNWLNHEEITGAIVAETLLAKSGLPSLAVAISEIMESGTVAASVAAGSRFIEAVCRNWIACLETGIAVLAGSIDDPAAAEGRLDGLIQLAQSGSKEFEALGERLAQLCEAEAGELHRELAAAVERTTAETLAELPDQASLAHLAQIDLKLRLKLEIVALNAFDTATRSVFDEMENLKAALQQLFDGNGLKLDLAADKLLSSPQLRLAALGEPAAVGLLGGFAEFVAQRPSKEERSIQISRSIASDFEPITAKLAYEAVRALNDLSREVVGQLETLTLRPLHHAIQLIGELLQALQACSGAEEKRQTLARALQIQRERVAGLKLLFAAEAVPLAAANGHRASG